MNIALLLMALLSTFSGGSSQPGVSTGYVIPTIMPAAGIQAFQPAAAAPFRSFDTLEGVSLDMTEAELVAAKGEPEGVGEDPWQEALEYRYLAFTAGLSGGKVLYVHVSPEQAARYGLTINGRTIDPASDTLEDTLGAPYFRAEDGDVYLKGSRALKVYRSPDGGSWEGIDFFDESSS